MSVFDSVHTTPVVLRARSAASDEAQLAAVAFLARYRARTLESYRADLRQFFQWAGDVGLPALAATRTHIELYRSSIEARGLAASTVDRRLSTVCGYYRFAHIDGRISANPAQYVRRPSVHPTTQRGMDRGELAAFLYTAERITTGHATLAVLLGLNGLRVSEACGTNIEDLGFERGHRTLRHHRQRQPARHRPARPAHRPHARLGGRRAHLWADPATRATAPGSTPAPPTAGCGRSANGPGSTASTRTCSAPRSSWPPSTPASRSRRAACRPSRRPENHRRLDRRRQNFDRHAAYAVVGVAPGSRTVLVW